MYYKNYIILHSWLPFKFTTVIEHNYSKLN
jgi:hypothetical protein